MDDSAYGPRIAGPSCVRAHGVARKPCPLKFLRQLSSVWGPGEADPHRRWVAAARRGEREAFDALVRAYERPLRGLLARRLAADSIDDVLQETWLAAWTGLSGYGGRARFKAWLYAIALRKCADHHRERGRSPRTVSEDVLEHPGEGHNDALSIASMPAQKDAFAEAELRHVVRAALETLPVAQSEVLELYYYAELTLAEIAAILGRHESTVKYQFYRAHSVVAQHLEPVFAFPGSGGPAAP